MALYTKGSQTITSYSGTSRFEHPLTWTLPNPNTFGEQIFTSNPNTYGEQIFTYNPNTASQFEHKHVAADTAFLPVGGGIFKVVYRGFKYV